LPSSLTCAWYLPLALTTLLKPVALLDGTSSSPSDTAAARASAAVSGCGPSPRALRIASGSKAKRSQLLHSIAARAGGLFQDSNRTIQEQLRDALVDHSMRVMDLFREWDEDGNGEISREEFRKALPMLGLHASSEQLKVLFDEFDADTSGSISFRELNRKLRRDVKTEEKKEKKTVEETVEIADLYELRRKVKTNLMAFSNVDVEQEEYDPLTGMMLRKEHTQMPIETHGRSRRRGAVVMG